MRRYADILGFANYATYKEVLYTEKYLLTSVISNFANMSERYVKTITRSHEVWAETSSNLEEVSKCIQAN